VIRTQNQAAPAGDARINAKTWRMCWVIVFGAFASGLDTSLVNIGLDTISRDLNSALSLTQWVASAYLLALALSLPLAGWLGRRFGTGRVWLVALALFTVASGLCAISPNIAMLIVARVLQGLAGGLLIPAGQTLLGQAVGPDRLGRVMATLGIAVSAAPAIGPLVGGAILQHLPWPWLFAINLPIGLIGLVLGLRYVPCGTPTPGVNLDKRGLALISLGLPLIVFAVTKWGDSGTFTARVVVTAFLGTGALTGFVIRARRASHPLLDMRLYRIPAYRAGSIAAFFSGALIFGSGIVQTLYFQLGRHLDMVHTGLSLLGVAGATAVIAPLTGKWIDRYGPAPVSLIGSVVAIVTTAPFVFMPVDAPIWATQALLIGYGAAVSLVAMPAGIAAYKAVSTDELPDAITQVNILQRVGGSLGGAVCAVLIAARLPNAQNSFHASFGALLVGSFGALAGAILILRSTPPRQDRAKAHGRRHL